MKIIHFKLKMVKTLKYPKICNKQFHTLNHIIFILKLMLITLYMTSKIHIQMH